MRITFSELHDASRPSSLQMTEVAHHDRDFLELPSAKNAMYRLSADQTGRPASVTSVPGSG